MREVSIGMTIRVRYYASIICILCSVIYGFYFFSLYGVDDTGFTAPMIANLFHMIQLIMLICISSGMLKYADPINLLNYKKNIIVFLLLCIVIIIPHFLINIKYFDKKAMFAIYTLICVLFLAPIKYCCDRCYANYEQIYKNNALDSYIEKFRERMGGYNQIAVTKYVMAFVKYIVWIVVLTYLFRFSLKNVWSVIIVSIINIFGVYRIHWEGISTFVKYKKTYFTFVVLIQTIGFILIKLCYDGVFKINLMEGRDNMEYAMLIIPFCLPLSIYGCKVSDAYNALQVKWIK